ncbi:HAMP domain-containing protein [Hylemonella gracilis]|uniref:HAMP domain-containing protein n=2 Tax=Hylemonella gracilis TaxID=80880 RepID=A0A4V1A1R2_9BURK|nr:HAMP domain-containing protein [Hylemonella gracilis]
MRIGARLGLGFGLILVLLAVVSLLSISRMARVYSELQAITDENNEKVKLTEDMSETITHIGALARDVVLQTEEAGMRAAHKSLLDTRASYAKKEGELAKMFESLASTAKVEKDVLAKTRSVKTRAETIIDKVVELGLANKNQEATQLLTREALPAQRDWQAALDELVDFEYKASDDAEERAKAVYEAALTTVVTLTIVAIVLGVFAALVITRSITVPIGQAVALAETVAAGDLSARVSTEGKDETAQLLRSLSHMQESLSKVVSTVRVGSESVATASAEIAQGNQDLSARTESQASALEETAASMEELSSTVTQNADNARQANQLAQNASSVAVQGGEVVSQVVDTMRGISEASRKIADIISVIDGIAFQTNILALNAAVEAARAGEQGRGFAVVASEVRSLAGRSAEAAKEIKILISDSVHRVEAGTTLVDQAGNTMQEVVNSIKRVTDIVGDISAASTEQSQGVAQIGEAVQQMDQVTQQNAALVEEMAAAANSLKGQAGELVQAVAIFKLSDQAARPTLGPAPAAQHSHAPTAAAAAPGTRATGTQQRARPAPKAGPHASLGTAGGKPAATKPTAQEPAKALPSAAPTGAPRRMTGTGRPSEPPWHAPALSPCRATGRPFPRSGAVCSDAAMPHRRGSSDAGAHRSRVGHGT